MEYNKFIYKINKYKLSLRDKKSNKKDLYQKKLDFYYNKVNEMINNIKNKKGGAGLTDADLIKYLEPATKEIQEHLDKTEVNLVAFDDAKLIYEENHKKIITYLNELDESNELLQELNNKADDEITEIKEKMELMDETHKAEIKEILDRIQKKIDDRNKMSIDQIKQELGL